MYFRTQYERIKRWKNRINTNMDKETFEDYLYVFFQNCYYLKDWLCKDPNVPKNVKDKVEEYITKTPALCLCSAIANGTKHFIYTPKEFNGQTRVRDGFSMVSTRKISKTEETKSFTKSSKVQDRFDSKGIIVTEVVEGDAQLDKLERDQFNETYEFIIKENNGRSYKAMDLVNESLSSWHNFLVENNLI